MIEPTGYTALDLIGFTDRGGYNPDAYYVKNDIVTVGNTKWRCLIDDTHNITPTEGANWTIYLESATSLAGMSDVTLTSPKNGDGLVHDGNDWKNIPITTKDQWKKNGAYNLCRVTAVTQSLGGLTITVNSDGTVTVGSGTASSLIDLALNVKTDMTLADGDYRLVGCPNHPYVSLRVVTNDYNTNKVYDYGTGGDFSFSNSTDKNLAVYLRVNSGTVISSPITFKPMITTDLNATYDDYVPYAKTNRELTEDTSVSFDEYINKGIQIKAEKFGKMARVSIFGTASENLSSGAIYTLPDKYKPKNVNAQGLLIDASTFSVLGMVTVLTDGKVNLSVAVPNGTITRSTTLCYVTA